MFLSFILSPSVSFIVSKLVKDKETKMKENLKIMGVSQLSYALSYFIVQGMVSVFVSLVMAYFISTNEVIFPAGGDGLQFAIILVILALANTCFSMTFSTLFADSKLGQMVGGFLIILPFTVFLSFVVGTNLIIDQITGSFYLESDKWGYAYLLFWNPLIPASCLYTNLLDKPMNGHNSGIV